MQIQQGIISYIAACVRYSIAFSFSRLTICTDTTSPPTVIAMVLWFSPIHPRSCSQKSPTPFILFKVIFKRKPLFIKTKSVQKIRFNFQLTNSRQNKFGLCDYLLRLLWYHALHCFTLFIMNCRSHYIFWLDFHGLCFRCSSRD